MKFVMRMDGRPAAFAARLERSFVRYKLMIPVIYGRTTQEMPHRSTHNPRLSPPAIPFLLLTLNPLSPRKPVIHLHFSADPPDICRSISSALYMYADRDKDSRQRLHDDRIYISRAIKSPKCDAVAKDIFRSRRHDMDRWFWVQGEKMRSKCRDASCMSKPWQVRDCIIAT